jgi:hypothetical protein
MSYKKKSRRELKRIPTRGLTWKALVAGWGRVAFLSLLGGASKPGTR